MTKKYPYITATISPELPTWEYLYHDWDDRNNKEFKVFLNNRAFRKELKLHGLTITKREMKGDELIITYY